MESKLRNGRYHFLNYNEFLLAGSRQPVHQQGAARRVDPEGAQVPQQTDQSEIIKHQKTQKN